MQIDDTPELPLDSPSTVTVIGHSLALELSWATHSAWSLRLRAQHPILHELATERPELLQTVRDFWDDGLTCSAELQILAGAARALEESGFDRLFDMLEAARASVPLDLPLRSETESTREALNARLAQLQQDERCWSAYRGLMTGLYAPLDEWWRSAGIPASERAVAAVRRELARGGEWNRMVSPDCTIVQERFPDILERNEPVVLVVCALFGKGLYIDLPGCQLIGVGAGMGEIGARARTEELARSIRVLADPTRLAIVDHLKSGARSIGDLALDFNLAQPTISVHVKQLRQAGLVTATRKGARLELSVDAASLRDLAEQFTTLATS